MLSILKINCLHKFDNIYLKIFLIFVVTSFGVFQGCAGCPYSFSGASVPSHLKTIAIPYAQDRSGSGQPTVRDVLTQKLNKKFLEDNNLRITDKGNSDAVLECVIVSITDAPAVISGNDQVSTRRLTIAVQVVCKDLIKKKNLFDKQFSNYGDYSAPGDILVRNAAIEAALEKISEDIVLETVSGW